MRKEEAAVRLLRLRRRAPMHFFRPSPALRPFIDDESRLICARAANRVGKTRHACYKMAKGMIERPGSRWRFIGPNRNQVQHVGGRYLAEFLEPHLSPGSYYVVGKGWNQLTIRLANGSIGQLKSFEDRPDTHAGDELDGAVLDEPPPRAILTENIARTMSRQGQVVVVLTPVGRPVRYLRELVESEASPWTQYVIPFSHENCPWYSAEQVADWLDAMRASPWDWPQRIEGAWEGYEVDRIYTAFTDRNVSEAHPKGRVKIGLGIDHGSNAGREVVVLVAWRGARVWILDEYVSSGATAPEEDADAILEMLERNMISPDAVDLAVGDINRAGKGYLTQSVNEAIEDAIAKELGVRRSPISILAADKTPGAPEWGIRMINYGLRRYEVSIHPRVTAGMASLTGWKGGHTGEDGELSHWADAFRYIHTAIVGEIPIYARLRLS